jgi:NAD(P)-dependent dehydrogenase (short-subunit alcohol dehydrogenase family)
LRYSGSTAVITGAGSGIGRALAIELASRGASLALSDIDAAGLAATIEQCAGAGVKARGYELDVADREAVMAHASEVASDFGAVHLVVNNAGVALTCSVEAMSWEDIDWLIGINFWGVVHGTKAFLPHLIRSGDGHLVNISSVFGLIGVPYQSAYNAAKFAGRGFTEALRQEMIIEGHPVTVSCVHPGGIRTAIAAHGRYPTASESEREEMVARFAWMARTTPERAALTILRGVDRGRARILVGPDAYAIDLVARVTGSGYEAALARLVRRSRQAGSRGERAAAGRAAGDQSNVGRASRDRLIS